MKRVAEGDKERGRSVAECSRVNGVAWCARQKTIWLQYGQRANIKESSNCNVGLRGEAVYLEGVRKRRLTWAANTLVSACEANRSWLAMAWLSQVLRQLLHMSLPDGLLPVNQPEGWRGGLRFDRLIEGD